MLNIQLGRESKQDVGLTKREILLRGVVLGACSDNGVCLLVMKEDVHPLALFWGLRKATVYVSKMTSYL